MRGLSPLPRDFYRRDPRVVAPELLNKVLAHGGRSGRIVEVEAYAGAEDPASHAYRGRTPRNASMFGPPGLLYVYLSYGVHWCANVVCGDEGEGVAVLIRALAPLTGRDAMLEARGRGPDAPDRELCSGPGRLCQALGIGRSHDGADLVTGDRGVLVADDGTPPPPTPATSGRIGLTVAADVPWRWYVDGEPCLSRRRPPVSAGARGGAGSGAAPPAGAAPGWRGR